MLKERGIPQTLSEGEIQAAKQADLQMSAKQAKDATPSKMLLDGMNPAESKSLRQTPDQKALLELAKEAEKSANAGRPISFDEALILDEFADEYNVPQHHQAYQGSGEHFPGGNFADHTHIYNRHVPYTYE